VSNILPGSQSAHITTEVCPVRMDEGVLKVASPTGPSAVLSSNSSFSDDSNSSSDDRPFCI